MKCARGFVLALGLALAGGNLAAAERDMPELVVTDATGTTALLAEVITGSKWIVLVLDADMALSREVISQLEKADYAWIDRLVVVTQGSSEGSQTLRESGTKLSGARWYRANAADATQALQLAGAPALVAVEANGKIGYSLIGFTDVPERNITLMKAWVGGMPP